MPHPSHRTGNASFSRLLFAGAIFSFASAVAFPAPPDRSTSEQNTTDSPYIENLRTRIKSHLSDGKVDEALAAVHQAMNDRPNDAAVRTEAVDLYLSLARSWMGQERFLEAEKALVALMRIAPEHVEANRLRKAIADARGRMPAMIAEARRLLRLEWYEPAFNTLRQARSFVSDDEDIESAFREAAVGAGDDNYFTKSFHNAFYYYDAALELDRERSRDIDPTLVSRWLQSLVHALSDDAGRRSYPEDYWRITLAKADEFGGKNSDLAPLQMILHGLAFEAAGDQTKGLGLFRAAAGMGATGDASAIRDAAIRRIRGLYSYSLSDRRKGIWESNKNATDASIESKRFRVHHPTLEVRERVIDALEFNLERIVTLAGWRVDEIAWQSPIDVYIHVNDRAFEEATGQPEHVSAISRLRRNGNVIESWSISARASDPLLLSSSLPHELFHLVLEATSDAGHTLPAFAEGLALHVEPPCRHRQFARLFREQSQPATLAELQKFEQVHPTTTDFYAQSHRLIAILRDRIEFAEIVGAVQSGADFNQLARQAGLADAGRLQRRYLRIGSEWNE